MGHEINFSWSISPNKESLPCAGRLSPGLEAFGITCRIFFPVSLFVLGICVFFCGDVFCSVCGFVVYQKHCRVHHFFFNVCCSRRSIQEQIRPVLEHLGLSVRRPGVPPVVVAWKAALLEQPRSRLRWRIWTRMLITCYGPWQRRE